MDSILIPDLSGQTGVTWDLLPRVSRTFALTIPALRPPLRDQVAIAYLLCRIADTIEDAEGLPAGVQSELFRMFLELIEHPTKSSLHFRKTWCGKVDVFHQALMDRAGEVLETYAGLPDPIRMAVADCLREMIGGMQGYVEISQRAENPHRLCETISDLEQYCHVVAGTVGLLLTRLFAEELGTSWATPSRYEQGRRFGLGLQITNVLKDVEGDRNRGVSYLPTAPAPLIPLAVSHLDQAHAYVLSIPASRADMRVFCVWASHLALATLARLARNQPGKVSRSELAELLEESRAAITDNAALDVLHKRLRNLVVCAATSAAPDSTRNGP